MTGNVSDEEVVRVNDTQYCVKIMKKQICQEHKEAVTFMAVISPSYIIRNLTSDEICYQIWCGDKFSQQTRLGSQ